MADVNQSIPVEEFEAVDVTCPACFAKPGRPCTQPDDRGRHEVRTYHLSREARAQAYACGWEVPEEPTP